MHEADVCKFYTKCSSLMTVDKNVTTTNVSMYLSMIVLRQHHIDKNVTTTNVSTYLSMIVLRQHHIDKNVTTTNVSTYLSMIVLRHSKNRNVTQT